MKNKLSFMLTGQVGLCQAPGSIMIQIQTHHKPSNNNLFTKILKLVSGAAEHGMFSPIIPLGLTSHLKIEPLKKSQKLFWEYTGEINGIDKGLFPVLIRLFINLREPITRISIDSYSSDSERSDIVKLITIDNFSPRVRTLPFVVNAEGDRSKNRTLRIFFAENLADENFKKIIEVLGFWFQLVALGGYQTDLIPIETIPLSPGEVYLVSPRRFEFTMPDCDIDSPAIDALINLVYWIHNNIANLIQLELD